MADNVIDANGWPSEVTEERKPQSSFRDKRRRQLKREKKRNDEPELEKTVEPDIVPEEDISMENGGNNDSAAIAQREIIRRQTMVQIEADKLIAALDAAIAAEKELGKQLYVIENFKKNEMSAANQSFGDDADFSKIIGSANAAKAKAIEVPNSLMDNVKDNVNTLVQLMNIHTINKGMEGLLEQMDLGSLDDEIQDKAGELCLLVEQNEKADKEFTGKAPRGVNEYEYREEMDASRNGFTVENDLEYY